MPTAKTPLMHRHQANPLMRPDDYEDIMQLFNPSPVVFDGGVLLLVSAKKCGSRFGADTYVATSSDGIHFDMRAEPFIKLDKTIFPYTTLNHHIIDNRITQIDDTYYILTPLMSKTFNSPCTLLGKTKDFETYEAIDIISQPQNRGASLFPEKVNGRYLKLDRPGAGTGSSADIWLSASPDLIHWGSFRPVLSPGYETWNGVKIGPTPPIKTDAGWLVIIHGVHSPAGGCKYYIGAILLDLEEPWRLIGKTANFLLDAREWYEVSGVCSNVVFPCGAIADFDNDLLKLYYGGADTYICLATGSLSGIIELCIK
jgi:beta-1,4-mannooligosaccharide/beta-1,4-mannosyl-N-acetylglucosamine phosphorylase